MSAVEPPPPARNVEPLFRAVVRPYRLGPLLIAIARKRLSGHLLLSSDMVERTIHFRSGFPVFSHSTQFGERLGPIAVRMELITREQLARALATARSRELELGRALISLKLVTGAQLFALLGEQLIQQVGAACSEGARARFFADRSDTQPILRLHPLSGVMAAVRVLSDTERKRLIEDLGERVISADSMPGVVRDWLIDVGFQGRHEELFAGGPTFSQLCARLGVRLHPGTRHRFTRPDQALPKPKPRPSVSAAPFGTHSRRKISSMQMLAVQSPPLDADAAELIALTLLLSGVLELDGIEADGDEPETRPRAQTAEAVLTVLNRPSERPPPELEDAEPASGEVARLVESYLFERRPADIAARMAVWGPGLEVQDEDAELLGQYLSVIHDSDPYRVLGVDSRASGTTIEEMRDAQLARLEHPPDASILVRAKAAELRHCVELAYDRLALMVAPTVAGGVAAPQAADGGSRPAAGPVADGATGDSELLERAQRMMFAGDYRKLRALLGPDEAADARSAPLRLAYALACSELASGSEREASVARAQQALGQLMTDGGHQTSALALWSVGHRTQRAARRGRIVLALAVGAALGYAAALLLQQ